MNTKSIKRIFYGGLLTLLILVAPVSLPQAHAASVEDLQKQIAALQAQLTVLMALVGNTQSVSCPAFNTNLTIGAQNSDVTALQQFLISKGQSIPAGATGFFGGQTQSALARFQAQHGITPAIGYFGPLTRAKVVSMCKVSTTPATPTPTTPTTPTTPSSPIVKLEGDEATISNFQVTGGEDTNLEEGKNNAHVMDASFKVKDGDIKFSRVDVAFTPNASNEEKKPWRTFKQVTIWNGTTKLGSIDTSNKSAWIQDSPSSGDYKLRFSGLSWIVREDKAGTLTVKVSTVNSIDGADTGESWDIFIPTDGMRGTDAAGVTQSVGDSSKDIEITIDESGSTEKLALVSNSGSTDGSGLMLKDNALSGWLTVFSFDIDSKNSSRDIEIRKLPVHLTVGSGNVSTFMNDIRLSINGKTYTQKSVTDGTTNTALFSFASNEFVIDGGDKVTVHVEVNFKKLDSANEGETIYGNVNTTGLVSDGANTLTSGQLSGSVTGETRAMTTKGAVPNGPTHSAIVTTVSGDANDYVTFTMNVPFKAFGQDVYIPSDTTGMTYQLTDSSGAVLGTSGTAVVSSNASQSGSYYRITDGETKTMTLEVTYVPGVALSTARLQLLTVEYSDSAVAPTQTWTATPATTYRTAVKTIVN